MPIDPDGTGTDNGDSMLPVAQKVKQELADLTGVHLAIVIGDRAASGRAIVSQHEGNYLIEHTSSQHRKRGF